MIAAFLDSHPLVQTAFVVGGLIVLLIAGLLVWACLWPLGDDCQRECCAEADAPPYLNPSENE